jgi:glutamate formiminotransferase
MNILIRGPVVQSAINFSEGRSAEVMAAIVKAAASVEGAVVADWSADPDHHRMVVTLLGAPEAVVRAALAASAVAVERIDLRQHRGAHPRIGAVDVLPLTPIRDVTMDACVRLSHALGGELARWLGLPVFYYEASAPSDHPMALPEIRRGGFEGLFTREPLGADAGPPHPHPTAGAVVVGARPPLVAWNINLATSDVVAAKRVAARLRAERERLPFLTGVRALGLWLPTPALAQVSMNLTRLAASPMPAVFDFVREQARAEGVAVDHSEIIGLIREVSLAGEPPERILWRDFKPSQKVEQWLRPDG